MKKFFLSSLVVLVGLVAFATLFFTVRQLIARAQVEREWQVAPALAPDLELTTRLEILPLSE